MSWFIPAEIAQMVMTSVLALVLFYLYANDRRPYLVMWALGWLFWFFKYFFEIAMFLNGETAFLMTGNLLCWLTGGVLLPLGVLNFLNQNKPLWFYSAGIIAVWIVCSNLLGLSFLYQAIPLFVFLGILYIITGIILIRSRKRKLPGQIITGCCLILLGMHLMNYPLLVHIEMLSAWGYLIAGTITWITANGMLLIYYQSIRMKLSDSEKRFRLLAENARDLIYRYRPGNKPQVEYISPSAIEITGYTPEEFYADPAFFNNLLQPDTQTSPEAAREPVLTSPNALLQWRHKKGHIVWLEHRSTPFYDKHGNLIAIEGIARDITDRKKAEDQITRLEESRRHLLSDISHDLRTPMTSIQGFVEALRDGVINDPEEKKKYLDVIHARVLGINRLIRDLFQLTNLEAQQTTFNFSVVPIDLLMQNIYDKFTYEVKQKGLSFKLHKEESVSNETKNTNLDNYKSPVVYVDTDRIDQIFTNLISNAISHTHSGGLILVSYKITLDNKDILISVKDNGTGISKKDMPYIFDRFYKVSKSRNSSTGGSGLGLAICMELIKKHGGRLWLESMPNQGTTVFFSLPCNQL